MTPTELIRKQVRARLTEQRRLVESLLARRRQLQGSLFARYGECGKESCACRQGRKHGPYYVLSTRSAGYGGFVYLAGPQVEKARGLVRAYGEFRTGIRRLQRLNGEIVALLRKYQSRVSSKGRRRLGLDGRPIA